MLIKVKNKEVASLPKLIRLALKYVYEKKDMTAAEENLMKESIVGWNSHVLITEQEKHILQRIAWFLDKADKGHFKERVRRFKKHNIDWRKFHRLPEAAPKRGYAF